MGYRGKHAKPFDGGRLGEYLKMCAVEVAIFAVLVVIWFACPS